MSRYDTAWWQKKGATLPGSYEQNFPMHHYADEGLIDEVKDCIESGDDIDKRDWFGKTPLHYAAINGQTEVVVALLEASCDAAAVDSAGRNAVMYAAQGGMIGVVEELINNGKIDINAADPVTGWTPLMYAAKLESGNPDLVQLLIEAGADWKPKAILTMNNPDTGNPQSESCNARRIAEKVSNLRSARMLRDPDQLVRAASSEEEITAKQHHDIFEQQLRSEEDTMRHQIEDQVQHSEEDGFGDMTERMRALEAKLTEDMQRRLMELEAELRRKAEREHDIYKQEAERLAGEEREKAEKRKEHDAARRARLAEAEKRRRQETQRKEEMAQRRRKAEEDKMRTDMEKRLEDYKDSLRQTMLDRWSEREFELRQCITESVNTEFEKKKAELEQKAHDDAYA